MRVSIRCWWEAPSRGLLPLPFVPLEWEGAAWAR